MDISKQARLGSLSEVLGKVAGAVGRPKEMLIDSMNSKRAEAGEGLLQPEDLEATFDDMNDKSEIIRAAAAASGDLKGMQEQINNWNWARRT